MDVAGAGSVSNVPFAKLKFFDEGIYDNDVLITRLPIVLGRVAGMAEGQFVQLPGKTVSRLHAQVIWDTAKKEYALLVKGRNPVTVRQQKYAKNERVTLKDRSPVTIGGTRFYFLLPQKPETAPVRKRSRGKGSKKKKSAAAAAAAAATGQAVEEGGSADPPRKEKQRKKRLNVSRAVKLDGVADVDGTTLQSKRLMLYTAFFALTGPKKQKCSLLEARQWLVDNVTPAPEECVCGVPWCACVCIGVFALGFSSRSVSYGSFNIALP